MEPIGEWLDFGLLPMKGHYFLFNAGTGAVVPYLATYGRQLGLSSILVGYILSLSPLGAMITKLIFGGLSDRYMKLRFFFLLFQIVSLFSLLGIHFIPEAPAVPNLELHCHGLSLFKICKSGIGDNDNVLPAGVDLVKCRYNCDMDSSSHLPEWRTQVCDLWKLPIGCSGPQSSNKIGFNSHLSFQGEISLNHSSVEAGCTYLRVTHVSLQDEKLHIPYCNSSKVLKANCTADCDNPALMEFIQPEKRTATTSQFVWFLLLTALAWSSIETVASLGDTICFGILGSKANKYGEQRVWGSIGWGASTFATGALIDEFSGDGKRDYSVAFHIMIILVALSFIISYKIRYTQTKMSRSIILDVRKVVVDCRVFVFILCCIAMGMCTGLLWSFLFWHLEVLGDQMGTESHRKKLLQGLTAAVQCLLGELPFFFLSGKIIKKLGHVNSLTVVLLAMGARLILYGVLVDPWWVLPIELLQGLTFGLFYATMVSYGSKISPPGTEATMQALVSASFGGIGVALGSVSSGWLYSVLAGKTFTLFGSGCLICCLTHVITNLPKRSAQYNTDSDGSKQSASYASPMDAVFITDNTDADA